MATANVLRHERFERAPVVLPKRRRGSLPCDVVSIKRGFQRLPVGVTAVIVAAASRDTEPRQNIGKRVVVTGHTSGKFSVYVDSLDGPLALDGGGKDVKDIRYRPANLRRVWHGLTTAERRALARLRLGVSND